MAPASRPPPEAIESPRLRSLLRELDRGTPHAVARFWSEIRLIGAPLIEPARPSGAGAGARGPQRGARYLTLLYEGARDVRAVELLCSFGFDFPERLERLRRTSVWYRTFLVGPKFRGSYRFVVNPSPSTPSYRWWVRSLRSSVVDPNNPRRLIDPQDPEEPRGPHGAQASEVVLPWSTDRPWLRPPSEVPGQDLVSLERVRSRSLRSTRRVWVYQPAGGRPARGAPGSPALPVRNLVIFFDGFDYVHVLGAPQTLDALQRAAKISSTAALFVDHGPMDRRSADLLYNERFADFLSEELLPFARKRFGWRVPPTRTVLAGASYGGLAAFYWAFRRSERFGAALSQSGSFSVSPPGEEPEWIAGEVVRSPRRPVRVHLEAGLREVFQPRRGTDLPTLLAANRHLRDVLQAKGYPLSYSEFDGGHDDACWRQTLATGLQALLGPRQRGAIARAKGRKGR